MMKNNLTKKYILGLIVLTAGLFVLPNMVSAETEDMGSIYIDEATIIKGYTVENYDKSMRLGVFPNSVTTPINVYFKQKNSLSDEVGTPENMKRISDLYEFDISSDTKLEFIKPLILELKYDSESFSNKHVYFWDARRNSWIGMPVWEYDGFVRSRIHLSYAILAVFEDVPETKSLNIDAETIAKGYTVINDIQEAYVGITHESVNVPIKVVIEPSEKPSIMPVMDQISNLYSFDLQSEKTVELAKSIYISLRYHEDNGGKKVIKYFDSSKGGWFDLPTTLDTDNRLARAEIRLPYAVLGVFEDNEGIVEGVASYFGTKDPDGCAFLDYEKGTWLRVTSLEDESKTVDVFIEDRGPYIEGRVIDLSRESFVKLAPLSQGVLRVRVQKL